MAGKSPKNMTDPELFKALGEFDQKAGAAAEANNWDFDHPDVQAVETAKAPFLAELNRRQGERDAAAKAKKDAAQAKKAEAALTKRRNAAAGRKYNPDPEDLEKVLLEALEGVHRAIRDGEDEGHYWPIWLRDRTRKSQQAIRDLTAEGFLQNVGRGARSMMTMRNVEAFGGQTFTITPEGEEHLRKILSDQGRPYPKTPPRGKKKPEEPRRVTPPLRTPSPVEPDRPSTARVAPAQGTTLTRTPDTPKTAAGARVKRSQLPQAHQVQREKLAASTARLAVREWRQVDVHNLAADWNRRVHRVAALVSAGQLAAARQADPYLSALLEDMETLGSLVPESLVGIASDGRDLTDLLMGPVWNALSALAKGANMVTAIASGAALLDLLSRTMVADAGRAADLVAMAARPGITSYVRVVELPACARCLILAGQEYGISEAFQRHPRCDCGMEPVTKNYKPTPTSPKDVFDAMTDAQKRKAFGEKAVEAIEAGSDIAQVVNARRGMTTATRYRKTVKATTEGQTKRGFSRKRRRNGAIRLMPEEIMRIAGDDREKAAYLLKRNGYLI